MPAPQCAAGACALIAAAALFPSAGAAQDFAPERAGVSGAIGAGMSSAGLNCSPRCNGDRRTGPTFTIRGVAYVAPQIAVVLEGDTYHQSVARAEGAGRWQLTWVTLGGMWYPTEEGDAYVRIGVGAAMTQAHTTFPTVGALDLNTRDIGFVIGVGRDFRLTNRSGFTIYADYLVTPRSTGYLYSVNSGAQVGADVINLGIAAIVF